MNILNEPTLTPAAADLHDRLVRARNGDVCYRAGHATIREAEMECNRLRRRLAVLEAANLNAIDERDELRCEVERLRGLVKLAQETFCGRVV